MWTIPELSSFIVVLLGFLSSNVHSLKVPFEVYPRALRTNNFRTTSKLTFAFGQSYAQVQVIDNKKDIHYATNITINGKQVSVLLDTGSTDLWVDPVGSFGSFNDTTISVELKYGDGSYGVSGTIGVSPFKFGSYEVPRQAFLHVEHSTVTTLKPNGIYGILGLSFDFGTASVINTKIKSRDGNVTWGQSVLHNIFDQDPTQPNFIALSLSRTEDLEDTQGGSFSISEYHSNYTAVSAEPRLPQFPDGGNRWTTLLESISVGGLAVPVVSTINNVPSDRGIALLDTGNPGAVFPTQVRDRIYSNIPGSVKYNNLWILPCNTTTIVELGFGGKKYPIHPLDLSVISDPRTVGHQRVVACVSVFNGIDGLAEDGFEYSLGDSFLRNVYAVFQFGNSTSGGKPYMQLLSRIDRQKAVSQVATIRGRNMASLVELSPADFVKHLGPTSVDSSSPTSVGVSNHRFDGTSVNIGNIDGESLKKFGLLGLALLAMNFMVGLALLVFAVLNCLRRGPNKNRGRTTGETAATHYVPVRAEDEDIKYGMANEYR